MKIPSFPLLDWLLENKPKAKYNLADSSMTGVRFSEILKIAKFRIPDDFDMSRDEHYGADELCDVLTSMYRCERDNIVTSTGGSEANFILFLALLEPGDDVVVELPSYPPLWLAPQTLGAHIIPWYRRYGEGFSFDIECLEDAITKQTKLVAITNLHNPSGVATSQDMIRAAAELLADHNIPLLVDEIYLDGADPPQSSAAMMDNVIITSSVSKVYGFGGYRTGWIICSEEIAELCHHAKSQTTIAAPYLSEVLTAQALRNGREKFLQGYRKVSRRNHKILKEWIERHDELIEWVEPDGGIICFPKYLAKMDSEKLCRTLLRRKNVLVSPGKYFGLDRHFRLTYRNPEEELRTALALLAEGLAEFTT